MVHLGKEICRPQPPDAHAIHRMYNTFASHVSWLHFRRHKANARIFQIHHYAGTVTYTSADLCKHTRAPVVPAVIVALALTWLLPLHLHSSASHFSNNVITTFKHASTQLMQLLGLTTPHFRQCIKSNSHDNATAQRHVFSRDLVMDRLRASDIIDIAELHRMHHQHHVYPHYAIRPICSQTSVAATRIRSKHVVIIRK